MNVIMLMCHNQWNGFSVAQVSSSLSSKHNLQEEKCWSAPSTGHIPTTKQDSWKASFKSIPVVTVNRYTPVTYKV